MARKRKNRKGGQRKEDKRWKGFEWGDHDTIWNGSMLMVEAMENPQNLTQTSTATL